jgi:HlyD family secretion protein
MKKYKWMIWVGLIVLAGIIVWFWKFRKEDPQIVLDTVTPTTGTIATTITATGTIQPVDTVAVGTQVSGTIKNVYADFNSVVKKGQLLAQLDKSLLQAQVQQVNANLQQAKSTLAYQLSNYNRQKQLFDVGAISRAELETAMNVYDVAKDNLTSAQAQIQSAQKNLSYSDIYSPIDGTVLSRNVSEGQTVAASFSTPTLFSIAKDLTKMQVRAAIDEADIGDVKVGQRASFTVDAFPDKDFNGTVKEIRLQASVSSNVVTYVTIIDAPNNDLKLKPGMTANIIVYTEEVNDALIIPAKALSFKPDSLVTKKYTVIMPDRNGNNTNQSGAGKKNGKDTSATRKRMNKPGNEDSVKRASVWVKKDSALIRKRITIGLDDQTQVQVLSGLTPDDEVVTGYHLLTKEAAKKATTDKSPFLPSRPAGGNRRTGGGSRP